MDRVIKSCEVAKQWYRIADRLSPQNTAKGLCYKIYYRIDVLDRVGDSRGVVFMPLTAVTVSGTYTYLSKSLLDQKLTAKGAKVSDAFGYNYEIVNSLP